MINNSLNTSLVQKNAVNAVLAGSKNRALGKHTKFCAQDTTHDLKATENRQKFKKLRYKTQSVIQKIMSHAEGTNRVCYCSKRRIDAKQNVTVSYNKAHKAASYSNVQLCGSHWICPVCSERHANEKKEELKQMLVLLAKHKVYAHMLTLTVPHSANDQLEDTLKKLGAAKSQLFKKGLAEFENVGHITSVEVKYSAENGWHPHLHLIIFTQKSYLEQEIKGTLGSQLKGVGVLGYQQIIGLKWQECCEKVGLRKPSLKHGVDLKRGYDDNEMSFANELINYALKDELSNELTKGHCKVGKYNTDSLTPFEIALMAEGEEEESPFAVLFREYAAAIKFKNQAKKSKKLREFLAALPIAEEEPEESDQAEEQAIPVFELEDREWKLLCADYEARGKLLVLIEKDIEDFGINTDNFPRTNSFLNELVRGSRGKIPPAYVLS